MKQIVIEISDDLYEFVIDPNKWLTPTRSFKLVEAVLHGVVLPKGHGRLIDADAFAEKMKEISVRQGYETLFIGETLSVDEVFDAVIGDLKGDGLLGFENTPTVVDADKGEE